MKRNKGITLIALVITIIVLLILAGITIASLSGENGILARAKEARDKTEIATIEEQIELAKMSSLDDNGEIVKQTLKSELEKIEGIDKITDKTNGIQVEYKGKSQFIPTGNGKIELGEDELEDIADGIIEDQGEQDYVIGIDVYGNQVDLANWNYEFYNADLLLKYTGKIENGTIIGEIPAYIIKSESGIVTKGAVTVLEGTFSNKTDLKTINVAFPKTITYYSVTFANSGITSIPPKINMDKAQNTYGMFQNCTGLTEIPQSFNLVNASNLQICANMFEGCTNLTTIPEGFALPSSVTTTESMFYGTKITKIPQSLSLANATGLKSCKNMFSNCTNLATIPEGFALPSSVTTTESMFYGTKITKIPQSLSLANATGLKSCKNMFSNCTNLATIPEGFALPSSVNDIGGMFLKTGITKIPSSLTFENLTKIKSCGGVFRYCTELTEIEEGFALPPSVTTTGYMFQFTKITKIPSSLNLANLSNLEECTSMFEYCESLTTIPEGFALPTSVTNCTRMFAGTSINTLPNSLNLVNLTSLETCQAMFARSSLTNVPDNFALPENLKNCSGMFSHCRSLQSIPDTFILGDNIEQCQKLFELCESLTHIPSNFTIPPKVTNIEGMFMGVKSANFTNLIIPEGITNIINTFANAFGIQGKITIEGNPTQYEAAFSYTARNAPQPVTVNYTSKCTNIEEIKATATQYAKIEFILIQ